MSVVLEKQCAYGSTERAYLTQEDREDLSGIKF